MKIRFSLFKSLLFFPGVVFPGLPSSFGDTDQTLYDDVRHVMKEIHRHTFLASFGDRYKRLKTCPIDWKSCVLETNAVVDGWGNPIIIEVQGLTNMVLKSAGGDGAHGTDDDLRMDLTSADKPQYRIEDMSKSMQELHRRKAAAKALPENLKKIFHAIKMQDIAYLEQALTDDPSLIKARDHNGFTPLHKASQRRNVEVVLLLIRHGADIEEGDKNGPGRTALHLAVKNSSLEIIQLLIENGADPYAKDARGRNAAFFSRGYENLWEEQKKIREYMLQFEDEKQHPPQKNGSTS